MTKREINLFNTMLEDDALLRSTAQVEVDEAQVASLIAARIEARKAKNFAASDKLRAELTAAGIAVEITKDGIRWKRK